MKPNEFANIANKLRFIDRADLVRVGVAGIDEWWPRFRDNPIEVFLRSSDIPVTGESCPPSPAGPRIRRGCPSHVAGAA